MKLCYPYESLSILKGTRMKRLIPYAPVFLITVVWLIQLLRHLQLGNDFYAPYVGATRLLAGLSPYGADATADLVAAWGDGYSIAGIAYPVPLLLLVVPFALLAFPLAASLWTVLGFGLSYLSVLVSRQSSRLAQQPAWFQLASLVLPFAFWPFFRAVRIGQASLIWFGIAVVLVLAIQQKRAWLVAVCVVAVALKPQAGLVFAAYGAWWLLWHARPWLWVSMALGGLLLGLSLVLQPQWIGEWLAQVKVYESVVHPPTLFPLGIVALLVAWRMRLPWFAKVALVQMILFPMTDIYSALPLLLAWCGVAPPMAVIGAVVSWLWVLLDAPLSMASVWLFFLAPVLVALLWEGRPRRAITPTLSVEPRTQNA
jgi:hypothetical protein